MQAVPNPQGDERKARAGSAASSRRAILQLSAAGTSTALTAHGLHAAEADHRPANDIPDWTAEDIPPQQGRRVVVTGGNGYPQEDRSGLGYQTALALARVGADVALASRNRARGEQAIERIQAEVPGATVRFDTLDLADLASVRAFGARMRASGQGLDALINNAGVMGRRDREESVDGFERVFATNTLGHFALAAELMPLLRQGQAPRVDWVASLRMSDALALDDLQLERSYQYTAAYDNSKLANLRLALEFDHRSKAAGWGVSSLASHPGVARTNLIPDGPGLDSAGGAQVPVAALPVSANRPWSPSHPVRSHIAASHGRRLLRAQGIWGVRGLPGAAKIPP